MLIRKTAQAAPAGKRSVREYVADYRDGIRNIDGTGTVGVSRNGRIWRCPAAKDVGNQ